MPIISKYRADCKISKTGRKKAPLTKCVHCPICGRRIKVRDSKKRGSKTADGGDGEYQVRRYHCKHCGKIHTELPSDLAPRKMYETDAIQEAIDGGICGAACAAEETTMRRWQGEIIARIAPAVSGLAELRANGGWWLA